MSEYIIAVILNLVLIFVLGLLLTALEKAENMEIDGRVKASIVILAILLGLIPYANTFLVVVWFVTAVFCIVVYFEDM